jgi:hypothetical protein
MFVVLKYPVQGILLWQPKLTIVDAKPQIQKSQETPRKDKCQYQTKQTTKKLA